MTKSPDPTVLALLATLEERARKNGEKSIVKSVVGRLADAGGNDELITAIAALRPKKPGGSKSVVEAKGARKAAGKAKISQTKEASAATPAVAS